jgi:hypothetical protein
MYKLLEQTPKRDYCIRACKGENLSGRNREASNRKTYRKSKGMDKEVPPLTILKALRSVGRDLAKDLYILFG